jgi:hypothetical protein
MHSITVGVNHNGINTWKLAMVAVYCITGTNPSNYSEARLVDHATAAVQQVMVKPATRMSLTDFRIIRLCIRVISCHESFPGYGTTAEAQMWLQRPTATQLLYHLVDHQKAMSPSALAALIHSPLYDDNWLQFQEDLSFLNSKHLLNVQQHVPGGG